jgi:hypothetical protein
MAKVWRVRVSSALSCLMFRTRNVKDDRGDGSSKSEGTIPTGRVSEHYRIGIKTEQISASVSPPLIQPRLSRLAVRFTFASIRAAD